MSGLVGTRSCSARSGPPIRVPVRALRALAPLALASLVSPIRACPACRAWVSTPVALVALSGAGAADGPAQPFGWLERFDAIHPSGFLAPVVLGYLSYCKASRRPGLHQQSLELVDCLDIATLRGLIDALLEPEYLSLHGFPWQPVPLIHRCCHRVHVVLLPTRVSIVHLVVPTSAYPGRYPRRWLLRQSRPFPRLRLAPAPMIDRIGERRQGYFVPDVRFAPL